MGVKKSMFCLIRKIVMFHNNKPQSNEKVTKNNDKKPNTKR